MDGHTVSGPLVGGTLVPIERMYAAASWGAWSVFHPPPNPPLGPVDLPRRSSSAGPGEFALSETVTLRLAPRSEEWRGRRTGLHVIAARGPQTRLRLSLPPRVVKERDGAVAAASPDQIQGTRRTPIAG